MNSNQSRWAKIVLCKTYWPKNVYIHGMHHCSQEAELHTLVQSGLNLALQADASLFEWRLLNWVKIPNIVPLQLCHRIDHAAAGLVASTSEFTGSFEVDFT